MGSEGRGRLFRRKGGKYLIYLPLCLAKDSMFPFKDASVFVKVSFKPSEAKKLVIEKWKKLRKLYSFANKFFLKLPLKMHACCLLHP